MKLKTKFAEAGYAPVKSPIDYFPGEFSDYGLLTSEPYVVGYWTDAGLWGDLFVDERVYGHTYADLPHPRDWVDSSWDAGEMSRVVSYLENGNHLVSYCGFSSCRFRCTTNDWEMGTQDLTDGVWIYPEGYAHYLKAHDVKPPEPFLDHIRKNAYEQPELVKSQQYADREARLISDYEAMRQKVLIEHVQRKERALMEVNADEESRCSKSRKPWWRFW